jgi:hypothetical protein
LELSEENIGNMLEIIGLGNTILKRSLINQEIRGKIDKYDYVKLKNFCTIKETLTRIKRQSRE